VFAPRPTRETTFSASADSPVGPALTAAPAPDGPSFVLSGIGISGDTRTAVLTATGADVLLVKVSDTIDGYTVTEISESSITLTREGERVVLRFKN
jgi:type II secretory pathway component PulC